MANHRARLRGVVLVAVVGLVAVACSSTASQFRPPTPSPDATAAPTRAFEWAETGLVPLPAAKFTEPHLPLDDGTDVVVGYTGPPSQVVSVVKASHAARILPLGKLFHNEAFYAWAADDGRLWITAQAGTLDVDPAGPTIVSSYPQQRGTGPVVVTASSVFTVEAKSSVQLGSQLVVFARTDGRSMSVDLPIGYVLGMVAVDQHSVGVLVSDLHSSNNVLVVGDDGHVSSRVNLPSTVSSAGAGYAMGLAASDG